MFENLINIINEYKDEKIQDKYYFQNILLSYLPLWLDAQTEDECKKVIQKIRKDKIIFVGDFIKACLKIVAVLRELKIENVEHHILKNIVNNQSLYI